MSQGSLGKSLSRRLTKTDSGAASFAGRVGGGYSVLLPKDEIRRYPEGVPEHMWMRPTTAVFVFVPSQK